MPHTIAPGAFAINEDAGTRQASTPCNRLLLSRMFDLEIMSRSDPDH
ncbi:hypothetical protein WDL1CHR_05425 [Variovorax sp. WDL1]|nr:hypothetical protein CHC06_07450 [Variovorax sp. B2]PNG48247.1 hypothetical protein CHC07_07418 [Variovorax sp. B4]VTV14965.1 hypothetical protein WDL1CHR_05425 [Variovorax sp. WDL1]